ncbi:MAG: lytic murein transglycosylase [Pseudomonadota bacterium]
MQIFDDRRSYLVASAAIFASLTACAAGPLPEAPRQSNEPVARPYNQTVISIPPFESSGLAEFDAWRSDFANRAIQEGRNPAIVYETLRDLKPLDIYLDRDADTATSQSAATAQAEFSKPIWEYVETAVSETRQVNALSNVNEMAPLLQRIEREFGVDGGAVIAIWGMETNFGGFIGDFDAPEALASMAVEGRRRDLAERELIAIMRILEQGLARRDQLVAGWAGAMGHTQFMPSTYLAHAVDFTGDNNIDIWAEEADALASAANYLKSSGYVAGEPWGTEVIVPDNFDFSVADNRTKRTLSEWRDLGLLPEEGTSFPNDMTSLGRMWTPAGASGPKYLLFDNFDVFLTYNRSNSYAYSVGLLSDVISGRAAPQTPWPTTVSRITVQETRELQTTLNNMGYDAGTADGIAGTGTRAALQLFQKERGLLADGYPTREALAYVRSADQAGASVSGIAR